MEFLIVKNISLNYGWGRAAVGAFHACNRDNGEKMCVRSEISLRVTEKSVDEETHHRQRQQCSSIMASQSMVDGWKVKSVGKSIFFISTSEM